MHLEYTVAIDTTGSAGQASGSGTLLVPAEARRSCLIEWVAFAFHADAPPTTEVSVTFQRAPEGSAVFRLTNSKAGEEVCPRKQAVDAAGTAIVGSAIRLPAASLEIAVAGCDPLAAALTVTMCVRRR